MTTRWRWSPLWNRMPVACATFIARSGVITPFAVPRIPSVPKCLRVMSGCIAEVDAAGVGGLAAGLRQVFKPKSVARQASFGYFAKACHPWSAGLAEAPSPVGVRPQRPLPAPASADEATGPRRRPPPKNRATVAVRRRTNGPGSSLGGSACRKMPYGAIAADRARSRTVLPKPADGGPRHSHGFIPTLLEETKRPRGKVLEVRKHVNRDDRFAPNSDIPPCSNRFLKAVIRPTLAGSRCG